MAPEEKERDSKVEEATQQGTLSRRQVLTAGLAAGAGLAAPLSANADSHGERRVGVAAAGSTAVEFRARLTQLGERFVAYGYVTRAHGADADDLFAGVTDDAPTALLTAYATGDLTRRTVDQSVHALDIEGTLTVYQRPGAGASFADPDSFKVGTPVARFALTLQDVLTVFAPAKGIPTLTGDMRQTLAERLDGPGKRAIFGQPNGRARFFATGIGTLVDPVTFSAVLEIAGNWTTT